MQKLKKILSSSFLALSLLFIFGVAMAIATFIENDFGTSTAWTIIYDSWWFELVMLGLAISFIANIYKYKMYKKDKWAVLLFHLAFIIIILGAGVTRYTSYGGVLRIREGESTDVIISDTQFLKAVISDGKTLKTVQKKLKFTSLQNNYFKLKTDFKGEAITIDYKDFIPDAIAEVVEDSIAGKQLLELVVTINKVRKTIYLAKNELQKLSENISVGFETDQSTVQIFEEKGLLKVRSKKELDFFIMASQQAGKKPKDSLVDMCFKTLYRIEDVAFVPMKYYENGSFKISSQAKNKTENDKTKDDALIVNVTCKNQEKKINLLYREGFLPTQHPLKFDKINVSLSYGAHGVKLPFKIQLDKFQLDRYPGSSSPSSYSSMVSILDDDIKKPYRIFMNNVLDYKGYRFFQASYDTDEKGTVLSVNHDQTGTYITYLGYLLMSIGMFFTLFGKTSHFQKLNSKLKQVKLKQVSLLLLCLLGISVFSQKRDTISDSFIKKLEVEPELSNQFGRLLVQDLDGRIKPINTLASEFIRKISRKTHFSYQLTNEKIDYNVNQMFLSMHIYPNYWQKVPLIKVDFSKLGNVLDSVSVGENGMVSFSQFIKENGDFILKNQVEIANKKKPSQRNEFDKEVLKVDERFNILYNLFTGTYLKIFPKKGDKEHNWYSFIHHFKDFNAEDGTFAKSILPLFFNDIVTNKFNDAYEKLMYIKKYQEVLASDVIPESKKIEAEILYNNLNLNFWLFQVLFTIGGILLIQTIINMFKNNKLLEYGINLSVILILITFLCFTANVILRWYVSGHAPWSNGYEMLVFVAWVLLFSGIISFRKSDFALPLATLFTGALLLVSYLDWISPEITNLMPVLKSYWLKVHVATIVSSYAPLALSAVLGLSSLIMIILKTDKNASIIDLKIKELSYLNEMSMTIGLFLLSVGTFLGGVWANESWGRYWAWDPKETWALISIIVYSIVLHLRLVKKLNSIFIINVASLFAFWAIIMTSFGVNYYLSGLHSYASGDPMPIPAFVYYVLGIMFLVTLLAFTKRKYIN